MYFIGIRIKNGAPATLACFVKIAKPFSVHSLEQIGIKES
jgi:hypothetical protein